MRQHAIGHIMKYAAQLPDQPTRNLSVHATWVIMTGEALSKSNKPIFVCKNLQIANLQGRSVFQQTQKNPRNQIHDDLIVDWLFHVIEFIYSQSLWFHENDN